MILRNIIASKNETTSEEPNTKRIESTQIEFKQSHPHLQTFVTCEPSENAINHDTQASLPERIACGPGPHAPGAPGPFVSRSLRHPLAPDPILRRHQFGAFLKILPRGPCAPSPRERGASGSRRRSPEKKRLETRARGAARSRALAGKARRLF